LWSVPDQGLVLAGGAVFGVVLRGFGRMLRRVQGVGMRHHVVVGCGRVVASLVVCGGAFVVVGGLAMVLGRFLVVVCSSVLCHKVPPTFLVLESKRRMNSPTI
jgi:hypothetical protein